MRYFLDCEFNGFGGALISLALARDDGAELYIAREYPYDYDPLDWVQKNVLPILNAPGAHPQWCSLEAFGYRIEEFMRGDPLPTLVADWPDDIRYFCGCLITGPGEMIATAQRLAFEIHRVDAYPTTLPGAVQHNALWDARALRHKLTGAA